MDKKWIWTLLCMVIVMVTCTSYLVAQENPAADQTEERGPSGLAWLLKVSGPSGWTIMFLSVAAVALSIQYFVMLQRNKLVPPDLLQDIEDLFEEESYEEVMETCAAEPGFFTNAIASALPRIEGGYEAMMESVKSVIEEESVKLQQKISWIQLISALAPMFGLLGTVLGMITAFSKIASSVSAPKPKDLALGIYEALVTTVEGLIVAIISLVCYFYLRNKLVRITMEITGVIEELLDRFRKAA